MSWSIINHIDAAWLPVIFSLAVISLKAQPVTFSSISSMFSDVALDLASFLHELCQGKNHQNLKTSAFWAPVKKWWCNMAPPLYRWGYFICKYKCLLLAYENTILHLFLVISSNHWSISCQQFPWNFTHWAFKVQLKGAFYACVLTKSKIPGNILANNVIFHSADTLGLTY